MTAVAVPPTRAPKIEFVNREEAERQAARAISLLNASDESKVEAWFAMLAVAEQVGPASNVGILGICWERAGSYKTGCRYGLKLACVNGRVHDFASAPTTLDEAKKPESLAPVIALLSRKVEELGGRKTAKRPAGTGRALVEAVSATPEGRDWLEAFAPTTVLSTLLRMSKVAEVYGRDGINPRADLLAHFAFVRFPDRYELVRQYTNGSAAQLAAYSLRNATHVPRAPRVTISQTSVKKLANRSGISTKEAATILRARAEGRSKAQLIRAINLAFES